MTDHPIPAEGVVKWATNTPIRDGFCTLWGEPGDGADHPVLVLPCDERGETEHSRILKGLSAVRREYEKATRGCKHPGNEYWERKFMEYFARIDALLGEVHAPGEGGTT